jgi:hypothetical protein
MYWEIKWQNYDEETGEINYTIDTERFDTWEGALGCYITHLCDESMARLWWIAHKSKEDTKGTVCSGCTTSFDESVYLVPAR